MGIDQLSDPPCFRVKHQFGIALSLIYIIDNALDLGEINTIVEYRSIPLFWIHLIDVDIDFILGLVIVIESINCR